MLRRGIDKQKEGILQKMKKANLNEDFLYESEIGKFVVARYVHGSRPLEEATEHMRLFFSFSPLELAVSGKQFFVPERSAIKISPGIETKIDMEKGAELYSVALLMDEETFLNNVKSKHAEFFYNLDEKERAEWDSVKDKELDYILSSEPNSNHIIKENGALIAPPHSRFNNIAQTGWLLMHARGCRSIGLATDFIFSRRDEEVLHKHNIITEAYVCIGGSLNLEINGENYTLKPKDILVAEPSETHMITKVLDPPYKGAVIQFPSIPGDKYVQETKN